MTIASCRLSLTRFKAGSKSPLESFRTLCEADPSLCSMHEVIQSGISHNARPEDIYGCLYFYLLDQLRELRHRLRHRYTIRISIVCLKPSDLASLISEKKPELRFDRIDVADHFDHNRGGVKDTLRTWSPFLAENDDAAIIGYCKNWVKLQFNGRAKGVSDQCVQASLENLVKNIKASTSYAKMYLVPSLTFSHCTGSERGRYTRSQ